jgi:ketosteroid isomerase-like protein
MKQHVFIYFKAIFFSVLIIIGCEKDNTHSTTAKNGSTDHFDLVAMKKFIREKNDQFTKAHITGDNAAIDTLFTSDGKSFPPNAEPVIGRETISKLTAEYIKYGVSEFHEETTELYGCEDMLIDQGNYTMTYGPDNTVEKGKYINVWKKVDGQWKIYSNMWNTNE